MAGSACSSAEGPPGGPRAAGVLAVYLGKCSAESIMDEALGERSKWAVVYFEKLMGSD